MTDRDASGEVQESARLGRPRAPGGLRLLLWLASGSLLVAGAIAWLTFDQRAARREGTAHTEIGRAITDVQVDMLDAETGQRGYLLTGDVAYLEPYSDARARIAADLARFDAAARSRVIAADTNQPQAFRALVDTKLRILEQTIAIYRTDGREAAFARVRENSGKRAMDELRAAARGLANSHSRGRDDARRRIDRDDALLLPLELALAALVVALVLAGLTNERRRARSAREASRVAALRRANDRTDLLLRELNHRVKNIFSVILAIVGLSARRHPEAKEVAADISARIHALALAHSASMGNNDVDAVPLRGVLERSLQPYCGEAGQVTIDGPDQTIPVRAVTPLGLILHELCTNAVKHGALSAEGGTVRVGWNVTPPGRINLSWIESMPETFPRRIDTPGASGFGTTMIDMAARQLEGTVVREWREDGLTLSLVFQVS